MVWGSCKENLAGTAGCDGGQQLTDPAGQRNALLEPRSRSVNNAAVLSSKVISRICLQQAVYSERLITFSLSAGIVQGAPQEHYAALPDP